MAELNPTQQTNQIAKTGVKGISQFLNSDAIKGKFTEILGQKGVGFISSVLSVVNSNNQLINADQNSIYTAALMAASLDLPINQNLGLAYIIPYNSKQSDGSWKIMAQFQIGYKGFKQLAQRTSQFATINESDVREGEITSYDRLTGKIIFNWIQNETERLSKPVIGYVSFFELNNGFTSTFYMTKEEVLAHGKKYSQTFKKFNSGLWKDEFDAMALKTVTKLNLSKNAPLSIEMQRAVISDQAVIKSDSFLNEPQTLDIEPTYIDNPEETKEEKVDIAKLKIRISQSKTVEDLEKLKIDIPEEDTDTYTLYADKKKELSSASKNPATNPATNMP